VSRSEPLDQLLRPLAPEVLGVLLRRHGRFDPCEDAVQEALLAATLKWPEQGVPENPRAWRRPRTRSAVAKSGYATATKSLMNPPVDRSNLPA